MASFRRYEVLLPLSYNDGSPVERENIIQTRRELLVRFGALTSYLDPLMGYWTAPTGAVVEDRLVRLVVDVPDTTENREFFVQRKEVLKERFQLLEVWITGIPLDII